MMSRESMKHCIVILVILVLSGNISCFAQRDSGKVFEETYHVGTIKNLQSFFTYNKSEKRMDSIYHASEIYADSMMKALNIKPGRNSSIKKDFFNNRSRVFLKSFTNNKLDSGEFFRQDNFPMPCDCYVKNDTIFVDMVIGFMGRNGINIKIFGKKFQSDFFDYSSDDKIYKLNPDDTAFASIAIAKSKYQSLILTEKPTFESGKQITGFLTFTSNNWYERFVGDTLIKKHVSGKLFFTCLTKFKW